MPDQSYLDLKYFVDKDVYNCPFCNRRNVQYEILRACPFDWSDTKSCLSIFVQCTSCKKESMHLSYESIVTSFMNPEFNSEVDIDKSIFYSVPTSFFVLDTRIPNVLRELITEAEGCLKMNFLTGGSACTRKVIYELLVREEIIDGDYDSRIKELKGKYHQIDPTLFDILSAIQEMTSDKVHEQSWDKWNSGYLRLILESLRAILQEIYVEPKVRQARTKDILKMRETLGLDKKADR